MLRDYINIYIETKNAVVRLIGLLDDRGQQGLKNYLIPLQ